MNFAHPQDAQPTPEVTITEQRDAPVQMGPFTGRPSFIFDVPFPQAVMPLGEGDKTIRLWSQPTMRYDSARATVELQPWNIRLRMEEAGNIPREIARTFLTLWTKAERQTLSDPEKSRWAEILEQVDFQQFCVEHAPTRYVQGLLKTRTSAATTVLWQDGTEENVTGAPRTALDLVNEGEAFSAHVRFDRRARTAEIANIAILGDPVSLQASGDDSWIQKR